MDRDTTLVGRDPDKEYVVTGAYVTMNTITAQGLRILGYGPGAPVPAEVPSWQFDHLLSHGLICAVGEEPVSTTGPTPEIVARQALDEVTAARMEVARAQARLDNALALQQAAEANVDHSRKSAEAGAASRAAAQDRVTEFGGGGEPGSGPKPDQAKPAGRTGKLTGTTPAGKD
jgi:hypothetical protein